MSFELRRVGSLAYWVSTAIPVPHCFSTRLGGVSGGSFASLNLGICRGDSYANVLENYRILGAAVGFRPEDTVLAKQRHTDILHRVGRADRGLDIDPNFPTPIRDGLLTDEPGTALVCFSADCTPVLLCDPVRGAVAAIHAGWRGTAQAIAEKAVKRLTAEFGSDPKDVIAAIGPCLGGCCFETHRDVPDAMRAALGAAADAAIRQISDEKYLVDLKAMNRMFLERAGVENVDICPACTACEPEVYWSHRRVGNERGALASIILLPE